MARHALILLGMLVVLGIPVATIQAVNKLSEAPGTAGIPTLVPTTLPTVTLPVTHSGDVTVTVDRSVPVGVSHMATGISLSQYTVDPWGNPQAVARGRQLLE